MKVNENIAISTPGVLLVPYDSRHVPTYHTWMEDELLIVPDQAVRAATASERLTLVEEYENQLSWRAAPDKLTFILCRPLAAETQSDARKAVLAGIDDAPDRMVGDINFFLHPWDEEEADDSGGAMETGPLLYSGEVDVMIAQPEHRGQGFGRAAVTAFLHYILQRQRTAILAEAAAGAGAGVRCRPLLKQLVVKIQSTNTASVNLFTSLEFEQRGDVNYFGEVELVREDLDAPAPEAYSERVYLRNDAV